MTPEKKAPSAGVESPVMPPPSLPPKRKSTGVAVFLSFICAGLGLIYVGSYMEAALWIGAAMIAGLLCFVLIGFFLLPIVWFGSMVRTAIAADLM